MLSIYIESTIPNDGILQHTHSLLIFPDLPKDLKSIFATLVTLIFIINVLVLIHASNFKIVPRK